MRVLYISQGLTVHDLRFLQAMLQQRLDVAFVRLERRPEQAPPPAGAVEFCLPDFGQVANLRRAFAWRNSIRSVARTYRPDVVHAGPIHSGSFLAATAGLQPLISMSWGSDILCGSHGIPGSWRTRFVLRRSALLLCDCQSVRQRAIQLGMPEERIVVFPWGADLRRFHPKPSLRDDVGSRPSRACSLVAARSLEPIYGPDILIEGFLQAREQAPSLKLVVLGEGSMRAALENRVRSAGADGAVRFEGLVDEARLAHHFQKADLYVSASRSDGSSVTLLQAMASGLPAIVSRIPGNLEWVTDEGNGWVFEDGDAAIPRCNHRESDRAAGPMGSDGVNEPCPCRSAKLTGARTSGCSSMPMPRQRLHRAADPRRVFALVQARMGSTRLPGKVLADIEGRPMLARVVDRALRARTLQGVVVASSRSASDDPIASSCEELGFTCFRGSDGDVLDRIYQAACEVGADVIVRITGDCPLIDPDLIDQAVGIFLAADPPWDLVANRLPEGRDFPVGLDIEVCGREVLKTAWLEATEPHQREHVLPFIYENRDRFRVYRVRHKPEYGDMRWTVDEPADLELVRRVFSHFGGSDRFSWLDVIGLFGEKPELRDINADVVHRTHRHVG